MCYERRDPNIARARWERDQRGKKTAEYIEREAVRDEFYQRVLEGTITSVEDTGKFLRDFPSADVAPVVRCSECVLSGNCTAEDTFRLVAGIENPFCCVGKRKDGDG